MYVYHKAAFTFEESLAIHTDECTSTLQTA